MSSSLANRLGDIPGVASVVVDLDGFGRGIDVRLEPGADETAVMEQMRALLATYDIRSDRRPRPTQGVPGRLISDLGVDIAITPIDAGARIEVATGSVRSFRIVSADALALAQGLADVWCQVLGRVPIEIVSITVGEDEMVVVAFDGEHEVSGSHHTHGGWLEALTSCVGEVLRKTERPDLNLAAS